MDFCFNGSPDCPSLHRQNGVPHREDVLFGVYVAVMSGSTLTISPFSYLQASPAFRIVVGDSPATRTSLGGITVVYDVTPPDRAIALYFSWVFSIDQPASKTLLAILPTKEDCRIRRAEFVQSVFAVLHG